MEVSMRNGLMLTGVLLLGTAVFAQGGPAAQGGQGGQTAQGGQGRQGGRGGQGGQGAPKTPGAGTDMWITSQQMQDIIAKQPGAFSTRLFNASTFSCAFIRITESDGPHTHGDWSE